MVLRAQAATVARQPAPGRGQDALPHPQGELRHRQLSGGRAPAPRGRLYQIVN